jgi:hypothetical protein
MLLYREGGVYLDNEITVLQPLDPLLVGQEAVFQMGIGRTSCVLVRACPCAGMGVMSRSHGKPHGGRRAPRRDDFKLRPARRSADWGTRRVGGAAGRASLVPGTRPRRDVRIGVESYVSS